MALPPALPAIGPAVLSPDMAKARADCNAIASVLLVFALIGMIPVLLLATVLAYIAFGSAFSGDATLITGNTDLVLGMVLLGSMLLIMLAGEILQFWVVRCLRRQQHWTLCMVMAALLLISFPLGTPLGIWMLVVLQRSDVRAAFGRAAPATA